MRAIAVACGFALAACSGLPLNRYGTFHRAITTASPDAQRCFDEGWLLCYGFNHDEAVRSFEAALQHDPGCAMACFGIAHALGPNINLPLTDPAVAARAHAAARRAQELSGPCTPVEQALIAAMATRYADPPPADRSGLDRAFADAMRQVWRDHPDDPEVGVLFAEAMLDLSPWNQWTRDGQPQPGTAEIVATLESVLRAHPDHPGANHFLIHATEASPEPGRALAATEVLPRVAPGCGHLVHMPAHTLMRLGRYRDAMDANARASAVDRAYFARAGVQGIYHFYHAHNEHFLCYAAMFDGDSAAARAAAQRLVTDFPASHRAEMAPFVDAFLAVPLHVDVRFGRWQDVLAHAEPGAAFPVATAMRHYARGVALANLDRIDEAVAEQAAFVAAAAAVPADATVGLSPAGPVLAVARGMLAGELAYRSGRVEAGLAALRDAVTGEDELPYDEPSPWMTPVRHALGALLLEAGRVAEAEAVYRADLARHPANGWALHGLAECLRSQGSAELAAVEAALARAWARADVELVGSCFCRRAR